MPMERVKAGMFARSKAGHDKGKLYIIMKTEGEYAYLTDGRIRPLGKPKKKKIRHIQPEYRSSCEQEPEKMSDDDIKRAIRLKEREDKNV